MQINEANFGQEIPDDVSRDTCRMHTPLVSNEQKVQMNSDAKWLARHANLSGLNPQVDLLRLARCTQLLSRHFLGGHPANVSGATLIT